MMGQSWALIVIAILTIGIDKSWGLLSSELVGDARAAHERSIVGLQFFYESEKMGSFCTGVLIRPDVVMTAAHCFDRKLMGNVVDTNVRYAENLNAFGLHSSGARKITNTAIHPKYDSYAYEEIIAWYSSKPIHRSFYDHDLALVLLDGPVGKSATVARLPMSYSLKSGTKLVAYGYGTAFDRTDARSYAAVRATYKGVLQRASLVVSGKTHKDRILTRADSEGGLCQGDSGGPSFSEEPLKTEPILFAINSASSGKFLGPVQAGVQVCRGESVLQPVGPMMSWIQQTLRQWGRL
jgi:hypothetical protein